MWGSVGRSAGGLPTLSIHATMISTGKILLVMTMNLRFCASWASRLT